MYTQRIKERTFFKCVEILELKSSENIEKHVIRQIVDCEAALFRLIWLRVEISCLLSRVLAFPWWTIMVYFKHVFLPIETTLRSVDEFLSILFSLEFDKAITLRCLQCKFILFIKRKKR